MVDDDREECSGVVVPLSLIHALSGCMLEVIDHWHKERGIPNLELGQCIVAMIAAVDASAEIMATYPDGETLQ